MVEPKEKAAARLALWLAVSLLVLSCGPIDLVRDILSPSEVLYVTVDGDDDNDCRAEEFACRTLPAAISKAAENAEIRIGPGTFRVSFEVLTKSVRIYGQGMESTMLDGLTGAPQFLLGTEDGAGSGISLWLQDLALENGRSGAVLNFGGTVFMTNVLVGDSTGEVRGGVYNKEGGSITLTDVTFEGIRFGEDETAGCAAITNRGEATLNRVTFRNNGGAEYVICNGENGEMQIRDSLVENNESSAIHNGEGGQLRVHGSVISANSGEFRTGGITNRGWATITRSLIKGNQVSRESGGGAGGIHNYGELYLGQTAVVNNLGSNGGGIYSEEGGSISLENVTISGNEVFIGEFGGIFAFSSSTLDHVTIANNQGYGLVSSAHGDTPRIQNSIIANNGLDQCAIALSIYGEGVGFIGDPVLSLGNNLASDDRCLLTDDGDMENVDPGLMPLAAEGFHPLLPGSRAIDAFADGCAEIDQRGVSRPQYDGCDIGAYEYDGELRPTSLELAETPQLSTVTATDSDQPTPPAVNEDSLCWRGPGPRYEVVSALTAGTEVQILGRGIEGDWWVIDNPRFPGVRCWAPAEDIDVQPNHDYPDTLFEIPPLPTATPQPGCLWYDQNQAEVCYPIEACPVDFEDSLGACIP